MSVPYFPPLVDIAGKVYYNRPENQGKTQVKKYLGGTLYFDAAASALKPESVVTAQVDFLQHHYANAGRGVCARASAVDDMVAATRSAVADFIGAQSPDQIVFTSGTTDGMNRIARILDSGSGNFFLAGKTIMVSDIDHNSARLPFEELWETRQPKIRLCPLDENYNLDVSKIAQMSGRAARPDIFVITAMSNVLGVAQDVKKIIAAAHAQNPDVITIVDAAQYVAHLPVDVTDWDCDFLCFSGHKIGADTGVGVMYIKEPNKWRPDKFGGGMVKRVNSEQSAEHNEIILENSPMKFEAGTLPLTQIAGLRAAIKELTDNRAQSTEVVKYIYAELSKMPRVKLLTQADSAMVSFVVDGMHALDFGALAGAHGVCLRVGNMCASWIHKALGIDASIRLSPGPWNTMDDAKELVEIVKKILR